MNTDCLIKVIKIERPGVSNSECITDEIDIALDELEVLFNECVKGDCIKFTLLEMTRKEYDNIPEFEGW